MTAWPGGAFSIGEFKTRPRAGPDRPPPRPRGPPREWLGAFAWSELRRPEPPARYLGALALVTIATISAYEILVLTGEPRLGVIFLGAVLVSALYLGTKPAILAAVAAILAHNYFILSPRYELKFAFPSTAVTAFTFLSTAIIAGEMAGRVRQEARRAVARARTMTVLFNASRQFSGVSEETALRERLAEHMATASGDQAVVLDERGGWRAAGADLGAEEKTGEAFDGPWNEHAGWNSRLLVAGGQHLGLAMWRPSLASHLEAEERDGLLQILTDLGAAAIGRCRLDAEKVRMEGFTRTEQLRTALLSSLSHDLRTPLSTILASATSLIDYEDQFDPEVRRDLLANIRDEAERLNRFLGNLLEMTKLSAGALVVKTEPSGLGEILERAIRRLSGRVERHRVKLERAGEDPWVESDPILLHQVIFNVLDNAALYSPADSEIEVRISNNGRDAAVEISDLGPGVPEEERELIFEKFYRSQRSSESRPGAGLGLSIAKGLVEAMRGSIVANGRNDGRPGLTVRIVLPCATAGCP
jgi:two-component system sensor histidine kinase KdpD